MTDSATLDIADNLDQQVINTLAFAEWAKKHRDTDAYIVYDYITVSDGNGGVQGIPGALNGVTVQWSHTDANADNDDEPTVAPVASEALHVQPGDTLVKVAGGFELVKAVTE